VIVLIGLVGYAFGAGVRRDAALVPLDERDAATLQA
jgi:hypothetical protein